MYRHIATFIIGMLALCAGALQAEIEAVWSTGVALPGEKAVLYLIDPNVGGDLFLIKRKPHVEHAQVELRQPQSGANPTDPQRRNAEVYPIVVTPDAPGTIEVTDLEVEYKDGRKVKVNAPALPVESTSKIIWMSEPFTYGVLWHPYVDGDGYVDQEVKVALKFLMPGGCTLPVPPQFNSVGVRAGTFRAPVEGVAAVVHNALFPNTTALAKGSNWLTTDCIGSYTPFREGNSDITGSVPVVQNRGFFATSQVEVKLPVFRTSALPLPPGTPGDYAKAVGEYRMKAATQAEDLAMNEAVEVEITVAGTGNLDTITPPVPEDADSWKLVPATRKPIVNSNGITEAVVFTQLMRPTQEVSGIPAFHFSYFDPQSLEYRQAQTAPIALPWRETESSGSGMQAAAAAEPPPAGTVPVAEMVDIYGFIPTDEYTAPVTLPRCLWLLLYVPAIALFGHMANRALTRRLAAGADQRARARELDALAKAKDGLAFLKGAGAYIESHFEAKDITPELQDILNRRDVEAFRPDAHAELTSGDRERMLHAIRKALAGIGTTTVLLLASLLPVSQAAGNDAANAYEAGQFSKAIETLKSYDAQFPGSPDVFYNIGNCEYRLKHSGEAAYQYAKALQIDPGFAEARANLEFIQRKEGAILPVNTAADDAFTYLNPSQLWVATVVCTAVLAFCIALLVYRRREPHKPWLHACTAAAALLSLLCVADWVYYGTREVPNIASLPPGDLAYIINATPARSSADADGAAIVTLPASTPVHLLAERADWRYVETFTGIRGWVNAADVRALAPGGPRVPVILHF